MGDNRGLPRDIIRVLKLVSSECAKNPKEQ
jgi:hypothetical protein